MRGGVYGGVYACNGSSTSPPCTMSALCLQPHSTRARAPARAPARCTSTRCTRTRACCPRAGRGVRWGQQQSLEFIADLCCQCLNGSAQRTRRLHAALRH